MANARVLILAAHPDDEVLGCGGVIQKHVILGDEVFVCAVTDGASSQYPNNKEKLEQKKEDCRKANDLLGVKNVIFIERLS